MKRIFKSQLAKLLCVFVVIAISTLGVAQIYKQFNHGLNQTEAKGFDNIFFAKNVRSQYSEAETHLCIHDKVLEKEEEIFESKRQYFEEEAEESFQQNDSSISFQGNLQEGDGWKPIRIHFDYSNLMDSDADVKKFIMKELIPAAGDFFKEFLRVKPLKNPLKVDPYYLVNTCGLAEIKIPKEHINQGIQDTDIVFYIKAVNNEKENFLAYASNCPQRHRYQLDSNRPVMGYFAMNLFYLTKHIREKDPMRKAQWVYTTIHEMTHSLVFSPTHFKKFVDGPLSTVKQGEQTYVNHQKIKKLAQQHFDCQDAAGAPLENEGGQGTAGAHWERKVFGNELMTGSSMYDSVLSSFTASMFEISGWYSVNQDKVGTLIWGKQQGCGIFKSQCNINQFCPSQKQVGCSYDYSSIGACEDDPLSDKCFFYLPYSNAHCNYPAESIASMIDKLGGATGQKSRCWRTDLLNKKVHKKIDAFCFESRCSYENPNSPTASFKFEGNWYDCKKGQDQVKVKSGYLFTCPDTFAFCYSQSACPDSCFGRGVCIKGVCQCTADFTDQNCSQVK
ncbi:hypothetical protein ABPG72_022197 [Tetrahymena utriculariae]